MWGNPVSECRHTSDMRSEHFWVCESNYVGRHAERFQAYGEHIPFGFLQQEAKFLARLLEVHAAIEAPKYKTPIFSTWMQSMPM